MGNPDLEAPPPSYNSIFGELQQQKSQSDGVVNYAKNATAICCGKVAGAVSIVIGILCCVAFGFALPIAEIVIGSMYLKDCNAQDKLPIYLIVMGVFSIVSGCTGGGSKAANRGEENEEDSKKSTASSCCNSLIGMFLFAWFVCGNVWVFKMEPCDSTTDLRNKTYSTCFTTDPTYAGEDFYCKQLVYNFVLYETIAKWAICGLLLFFGCICCTVMCCVYCCNSKPDES